MVFDNVDQFVKINFLYINISPIHIIPSQICINSEEICIFSRVLMSEFWTIVVSDTPCPCL